MTISDSPASAASSWSELIEEFGERWNRFWFTPSDPTLCAILRIAVGALAALHFVDLASALARWFARDGLLPPETVTRVLELTGSAGSSYRFSHLNGFPAGWELWALHVLAMIVSLAFAAGLFTRVTGVLTLVAMLSYVHRAPLIAGHVEPVLSFMLAYLVIAPSGAVLSVDRWLRSRKAEPAGEPEQPSVASTVGLRLIQVHLAMFYAMMGLTKLYGDAWWEGDAIWILLAQTESRPLDLTGLRRLGNGGNLLLNLWTHFVVYFELAFPVLIWNRFTRPVLLLLSVAAWVSIIVATGHVLFGLTMMAAGMAFLPRPTAVGASRARD